MVRSAYDAVLSQALGQSSPFGLVRVDSNRPPGQVVGPATVAAGNLVAKAVRARMRGDADRGAALMERAVQLPYDEHEEWWPALQAVRREVDGSSEGLVFDWGPDASLHDRRRVTLAVLDVVVDYAGARSAAARV